MGRHVLKANDDDGFLRAAWDYIRDTEHTEDVHVTISAELTNRRGVLKLILRAYGVGQEDLTYPRAKYSVEYPSAQVGTLAAALYQCSIKLDHILTQQALWPEGKA